MLDGYVGRYEVSPKMMLTVERRGGDLYLKGTGGFFLPLEPLSVTRFFFRQLYVPLVFAAAPTARSPACCGVANTPAKKSSDHDLSWPARLGNSLQGCRRFVLRDHRRSLPLC